MTRRADHRPKARSSRHARAAWRRAQLGAVVVGVVAVALGVLAYAVSGSSHGAPPAAYFAPVNSTRSSAPGDGPQLTGGRIAIPRFGVMARVEPVTSPDGVLGVPLDPSRVGWWTGSAMPGSGRGGVVVDGHVNYRGTSGALSILPKLHAGDAVRVHLPGGGDTVDYRVRTVREYSKHPGLPSDIFDQDGPERLVLITCGGTFDSSTGNYESNVIAFAYRT